MTPLKRTASSDSSIAEPKKQKAQPLTRFDASVLTLYADPELPVEPMDCTPEYELPVEPMDCTPEYELPVEPMDCTPESELLNEAMDRLSKEEKRNIAEDIVHTLTRKTRIKNLIKNIVENNYEKDIERTRIDVEQSMAIVKTTLDFSHGLTISILDYELFVKMQSKYEDNVSDANC